MGVEFYIFLIVTVIISIAFAFYTAKNDIDVPFV